MIDTKKAENLRDVWTEAEKEAMAAIGGSEKWGAEAKQNSSVLKPLKPPVTIQRQREARISQGASEKALPVPEEGMSYNPRLESYQALLDQAVEEEQQRLKEEQDEENKILRAGKVKVIGLQHYERGTAPGMAVADGDAEAMREEAEAEAMKVEEEEEAMEEKQVAKKENKRKTQTEKNKAKRKADAVSIALFELVRSS